MPEHKIVAQAAFSLLFVFCPFAAVAATESALAEPVLGMRKIFLLLFLMLGPIKVLLPFVELTRGTDALFRWRLATRAILFSAAALILAGVLGRTMLENFGIPVPVLALTGGLVLFLVALHTILEQFSRRPQPEVDGKSPDLRLAMTPLAFPTIVTPYGIAAVIIFATLLENDSVMKLQLLGIVLAILLMDWLAMLFAHALLKWLEPFLQVVVVVLGVAQIALGLEVMLHNLGLIGVFPERLIELNDAAGSFEPSQGELPMG